MPPTLTQSQPLFSPKRKSVYPIFDILSTKPKCQIRPVAYHLFEFFRKGEIYKSPNLLTPMLIQNAHVVGSYE